MNSTADRFNPALIRWLAVSCWRQQRGPLIASIVAIAMGVALGLGISLVNNSALSEFDDAISRINGQAQYQLTGALERIDDSLLSVVEQDRDVVAASPVIDLDVSVIVDDETNRPLKLVGLDIFRAAQVAPALLPSADPSLAGGAGSAVFSDDAIFLSTAAQQRLQARVGEQLAILVNGRRVSLTVSGDVPGVDSDTSIAIMDIGAAQWRLDWLEQLSRIDLRLAEGVDGASWVDRLKQNPLVESAGIRLDRPDADKQRMSNLSRAYRVNLNVLALVALLTGGFIVFATLDLAITRMVPTLSLVLVVGAPPGLQITLVLVLSLVLGLLGAALGAVLGIALAWTLLAFIGGDLGSGLFAASSPSLSIPAGSLLLFFFLGLMAALAGGLSPALKVRKLLPAQALKSGQLLTLNSSVSVLWTSFCLFLAGIALLFLPQINGLPIAAYLSIACWLFAGVLVVSPLLGLVSTWLSRWSSIQKSPFLLMGIMRLRVTHTRAFPALAGVVASFALVCAMAIMVYSFRVSVDRWLESVLPASLYVGVDSTSAQAAFDADERGRLAGIEGVEKIQFVRSLNLIIDADQPAVHLVARTISADNPGADLPITGRVLNGSDQASDCTMIYISEPASGLYDWQVGERLNLPLPLINQAQDCFQVAAVWRDYARQSGAIAIDRDDYRALTGDPSVSSASIWLEEGESASAIADRIRAAFDNLPGLQISSAEQIRALSLNIFDRSFAVTYALEAVALLVSLFGVATTYSGEALSRMREFGMLRHLGVTRRKIASVFVYESVFCIALGVLWGALLGAAISQVLVQRVNPQSFNWSMQTHWPFDQLFIAGAILVILGALTASISARKTTGIGPIEAVRRDW
ncbi:MAG: FtsX-like permease family protein [Granulosicoccus sp.]